MLDAVRIAGRWISVHVLARLSSRATSDHPPTRRRLVKDFCQATHWRNRKGELCVSSANAALNRLEKQGLVHLTPPQRFGPRDQVRQLRDDRQALPPVPKLSHARSITLQLIEGQNDPEHLLWNRLIIREHPLGAKPIVGQQLRYLIRCPPSGWVPLPFIWTAATLGLDGTAQPAKRISFK